MKIESMEQLLASGEFKKEQEELQAVIKSIVGKYDTLTRLSKPFE